MFFNVGAFGISTPTNKVVINNRTYSKVNLIGNAVFDGVHLKKKILTDQEILDIETVETFAVDTVFLANFENNLEAGNYTALSKPVTIWRIRRKKVGNFTSKFIKDVDVSVNNFTDYSQANRTNYEYQLSAVAADGTEGLPFLSLTDSDFFGWYLCSLDNSTVYKFDMNIESDSIALNMDIKLFEGFTKYPVTRQGKRKYHSGGLKTMPYSLISQNVTINNELLREIEAFISNGKTKLLKNTSGDLFQVTTSDFSYQYMDTFTEQPYTISFKWTQVGDGE